jgi:hypothetical protein
MKPIILFALLALALFTHTMSLSAAETSEAAKLIAQQRDELLTQAQARSLTAKEHFDLSVALLGAGQFAEALIVTKLGSGTTKEPHAKSLFSLVAAQALGAQGNYEAAAEAALAGQRLNPLSVELAALRFAYFTKIGNAAQAKSAEDTLKQLDPSGQPVLTGAEVIAIAKGVIEIAMTIKAVYEVSRETWPRIQPEVERLAVRMTELWAKLSPSGSRSSATLRTR